MTTDNWRYPLSYDSAATGWAEMRLKRSVAASRNGVWGDDPDGENDLVCVRVADFDRQTFRTRENKKTLRSIPAKDRPGRVLRKGDLLLEKSGGGENTLVGCVVQFTLDDEAVCSNFVARLVPALHCTSRFLVYLHSALYAAGATFPAIKQTTGIQNLDEQQYLDILVRFPGRAVQDRIAAYLDIETEKIDQLVDEKERLLKLLEERRQALITEAVTRGLNRTLPMKDSGIPWLGPIPAHWNVPTIGMRYEVQLGKMLDEKRISGDFLAPYLRNVDVQWEHINTEDLPEMDFGVDDRKRFLLQTGDVLVCEGGEVGRSAIWGGSIQECFYQKALHRLRRRSERDYPPFLVHFMRVAALTGGLSAEANASTIQHLPAEKLRMQRFPAPPFEEQKTIVFWIDKERARLHTLEVAVRESIAVLTEKRSSLIHEAVTGKLAIGESP